MPGASSSKPICASSRGLMRPSISRITARSVLTTDGSNAAPEPSSTFRIATAGDEVAEVEMVMCLS